MKMEKLLNSSLPMYAMEDFAFVPRVAKQHICFIDPADPVAGDPDPVDPQDPVDPVDPADPVDPVDPKPEPAPAKTVPAWQLAAAQKRIDKLTAKNKALETAAPKADGPKDVNGKPLLTEAQATEMAREMARVETERQEFDQACSEVVRSGKALFPDDWQPRLAALIDLKDDRDPDSVLAYNTFIQAAVASGEGARLIHDLAGDLDEAQRIMGLSPIKMTAELTRRANKLQPAAVGKPAAADVSNAPKPITPIGGRKSGTFDEIQPDDPARAGKLSSEEWHRRRNAQVDKRMAG